MRLLSADWVLPLDGDPIENGALALEGAEIVAVGTASELGAGERFADAAILPGFVNAHTHLEYAVYAGFGDGLPFSPWLDLHIERKQRIGFDEMVAIARLGAAESLASGVTTIADSSFSGASAPACAELGLRATVYLEVFGSDGEEALADFERRRDRVDDAFSDRVRLGIGPHAPYSVPAHVYADCAELGLPLTTHISETAAEVEWLTRGTGPLAEIAERFAPPAGTTGTRLLAQSGLLGPELLAAHCVHVDSEEIRLLAAHGTGVAHCARSNALLGCGVAPLVELRDAGVSVGLGTDSPASAPSFDVFEEMRAATYGARARVARPDALTASEALELATLGSARALALADEIGSLAPGKRADLAVVSLAGSPYLPWEDPAAAIVFGGSPERVELTLVDGEERYRKGGFEWHELRHAAARARARLLGNVPEPTITPKT
jgi:5-methylthioadenosine/S-adenosylhomocysteine deaminase